MHDTPTAALSGAQAPGFFRFRIGDLDAIALHDGVIVRDRPPGFVRNADDASVGEAFAAIGLPRDKLSLTFTALALCKGDNAVLIDTGFGAGGPAGTGMIAANLAASGLAPDRISSVLISHFHGDHISGLRHADGTPAFPNAEVVVPQPEWDFWMDDGRMAAAPDGLKPNFALVRRLLGDQPASPRRFAWDDEVLPGITALRADGHTPGHTAFLITSGAATMMYVADITNNPLLFARHPEWQAMFDIDPQQAVVTRRRLLDQAATDRMRLSFFHAPFPSTGYVLRDGAGFTFAPAMWAPPGTV